MRTLRDTENGHEHWSSSERLPRLNGVMEASKSLVALHIFSARFSSPADLVSCRWGRNNAVFLAER